MFTSLIFSFTSTAPRTCSATKRFRNPLQTPSCQALHTAMADLVWVPIRGAMRPDLRVGHAGILDDEGFRSLSSHRIGTTSCCCKLGEDCPACRVDGPRRPYLPLSTRPLRLRSRSWIFSSIICTFGSPICLSIGRVPSRGQTRSVYIIEGVSRPKASVRLATLWYTGVNSWMPVQNR